MGSSLPLKSKIVLVVLLGVFFLIFYLFNYLIYSIITFTGIPSIIAIVLIILGYYFSMRSLVRVLAFPGYSSLFKRNIEYSYNKSMSTEVMRQVVEMRSCIEMYMGGPQQLPGQMHNQSQLFYQDTERTELLHLACQRIMMMITSLESQIESQRDSQQIVHEDQEAFMNKLQGLKAMMCETKILYDNYEFTLWDFAQQDITIQGQVNSVGANFSDNEKRKGLNTLMEYLGQIEGDLIKATSKATSFKQTIQRFLKNKTFGSFEQMRVEMELRYKAEQVFLTSADRTRIHCYWVPCHQAHIHDEQIDTGDQSNSDDAMQTSSLTQSKKNLNSNGKQGNSYPTMIFCNPNAGFAEFFQYQSDWLDYYVQQGINVFVWNYRGFGLSEGAPSPRKIKEDAEIVALYVRQRTMPPQKVGAHGLSMGGLIAAHLARKGLVDFLFADRTFSSLDEVPVYSMGAWAKYSMKLFTLWKNMDGTQDYIFSNCYKVIATDPNDEVINDNASMKTGVSLKIIQMELKNRELEKTIGSKNSKKQAKIQKRKIISIQDYYHILNHEETMILFTNLDEMFEKIFELELNNKKLRKKIVTARGGSGNKSKVYDSNISTHQDYLASSQANLNGTEVLQTDFENSYLLTELNESSFRQESPHNVSKIVGSTQRRKSGIRSQALREKEKKIRQAENDNTTDFIEYLEMLVDFFKQMERLDSGGRVLQSVFKERSKFRFQSFRNWIINLDVWGSFQPLNIQCYDIQLTRTAAYTKVNNFRKQIKVIIQQKRDFLQTQGPIMKKLLTQCEVIDYYFSKIENYLGKKHRSLLNRSSNTSSCGDISDTGSPRSTSGRQSIIEDEEQKADFEDLSGFDKASSFVFNDQSQRADSRRSIPTASGLTERNIMDIDDDNIIFKDFTEPDLIKTGYLIPLTCGHNGQLSMNEKTIYEIHLTNAGFLTESNQANQTGDDEADHRSSNGVQNKD